MISFGSSNISPVLLTDTYIAQAKYEMKDDGRGTQKNDGKHAQVSWPTIKIARSY